MTHHIFALYCACSYFENFQLYAFEFPKASLVFHLPPDTCVIGWQCLAKSRVTLVLNGVALLMVKIDLI